MIPRELNLPEHLDKELMEIVQETGEPAAVILRLCIRAGLAQIRRDAFQMLKLDANASAPSAPAPSQASPETAAEIVAKVIPAKGSIPLGPKKPKVPGTAEPSAPAARRKKAGS